MLLAVVHAGGIDAARGMIARAVRLSGPPDESVDAEYGLVAGWRGAAPVEREGMGFVEGAALPAERAPSVALGAAPVPAGGDFAFAAIDGDALVVASGPGGGHRPIFVVVSRDWAGAATRLRLLLELLDSRPSLDLDYLCAAVTVEYPVSPHATPFVGIHHVPLGEAWRVRPGAAAERRSLPPSAPRGDARGDVRDGARALREAIENAVSRATSGVQRVGVAFSGGLDSSSVLVTLANLRRRGRSSVEMKAYSWDFDTPDPGDDRPFRRAVESRVGVTAHAMDPRSAGHFVRRGLVLDAMPCTDVPCAIWLALGPLARADRVERVLTGVGGDNVLDGNPWLYGALARTGRPLDALRRAIRLRGMGDSVRWRVTQLVLWPLLRSFVPESARKLVRARRRRRVHDWSGPALDEWLRRSAEVSSAVPVVTLDSSPAERYAALARMPFLSDICLLRGQQEEATHYWRTDPLFDDEVLRVVASLPPLALLAGDHRRGLLREAMSDLLPEPVRNRPHKAYMEPALARMMSAAGGFEALADLAPLRRLADLRLVLPDRFRAQFDGLVRAPLDAVWWTVWAPLAVEEFLRQYDEGWSS